MAAEQGGQQLEPALGAETGKAVVLDQLGDDAGGTPAEGSRLGMGVVCGDHAGGQGQTLAGFGGEGDGRGGKAQDQRPGAGPRRERKPLTPFQDKAAIFIFFADILAMIFAGPLGLETWFIAFAGGLLMVCCGALDHRTALKEIPWDMIMLFVGALGLGTALTETGAGTVVSNWLAGIVGGTTNNYLLGALFFLVPFIITQFMLNRAVNQIFTPICLLTCQALGANPIGLILLVSAGSLTAFLTPMSTPAVAMCMGEGGYDLRSILKSGWAITILLSVVYIFYTMTVYPAF